MQMLQSVTNRLASFNSINYKDENSMYYTSKEILSMRCLHSLLLLHKNKDQTLTIFAFINGIAEFTISTSLPLNHSRRVVVSYKRKYVHEVLVNCLFKLVQEKVWLGELTVPQ